MTKKLSNEELVARIDVDKRQIVSWKGAKPSLDLRLWRITADGQRPLKGLTLSAEEAGRLYNACLLYTSRCV